MTGPSRGRAACWQGPGFSARQRTGRLADRPVLPVLPDEACDRRRDGLSFVDNNDKR